MAVVPLLLTDTDPLIVPPKLLSRWKELLVKVTGSIGSEKVTVIVVVSLELPLAMGIVEITAGGVVSGTEGGVASGRSEGASSSCGNGVGDGNELAAPCPAGCSEGEPCSPDIVSSA